MNERASPRLSCSERITLAILCSATAVVTSGTRMWYALFPSLFRLMPTQRETEEEGLKC